MLGFIMGLALLSGVFGLGFHVTGALLGMIFLVFVKLPLAMIFAMMGIVFCITIILLPFGKWCVRTASLIQATYENSIEETIQEAERITVSADDEDANWFEKFTQWISNAAVTVSEYVTRLLSKFVEALAVMIVTSCLIPILVVAIFIWLLKALFGIQAPINVVAAVKPPIRHKKPEVLIEEKDMAEDA